MKSSYSIPVVHPAFELLKKSSVILHFIAASVICTDAVHSLFEGRGNNILCYAQLIIAADIYLLILVGKDIFTEAPRINLFFRFVEVLVITGIGFTLVNDGYYWLGAINYLLAFGYIFLFYRERKIARSESVNITHTGVAVPDFLKDGEISWDKIKKILPVYHGIMIETIFGRKIELDFRKNLNIAELEQINEFCSQHLSAEA